MGTNRWFRQLAFLSAFLVLLLCFGTVGSERVHAGSVIDHVVQPGETLTAIANRYNVSVSQIMRENNIQNQNLVTTGQRLRISVPDPTATPPPTATLEPTATPQPTAPPVDDPSDQSPQPSATPDKEPDSTAAPAQPTATPEPVMPATATPAPAQRTCSPYPGAGEMAHTVRQGNSLSSIASTYGTTARAIRNRNCLKSDLLIIGQRIIVPYGSRAPSAPDPTATPSAESTPRPQPTATPTRVQPSPTPRPTATSAPQPTPTKEASWWDRWRNK